MLDARGRLIVAALNFAGCSMPSKEHALCALRMWLASWPGVATSPTACTAKDLTCS
jgi:hypothetical protein